MYTLVVQFIFAMLLAACSSAPYHPPSPPAVKVSSQHIDLNDSTKVKQALNQQYKEWRGVRHRTGGLSKNGIDCSGLVYLIYREDFGIDMPRTTDAQSGIGRTVNISHLKAGDLVFFKTGLFKRHVGMYIDKGVFLHTSSSKGVMT